MALSHVLSRDQVVRLGYFTSTTRANTRLRELRCDGLIRRIETPFFGQSLYAVSRSAMPYLGETIARLVRARTASPRFLQHALSVTEVRIALIAQGADSWRFEQQLRSVFEFAGKRFEVRPDGLVLSADTATAIEVDLGHVAPSKFKEKLYALDAFIASGDSFRQWTKPNPSLLAVTTGERRAHTLRRLAPSNPRFHYSVVTFSRLGIAPIGGWS